MTFSIIALHVDNLLLGAYFSVPKRQLRKQRKLDKTQANEEKHFHQFGNKNDAEKQKHSQTK